MLATLDAIKSLLNSEKIVIVSDSTIKITEPGREASLKHINIVSAGKDAIVLKFDHCGFPGSKIFTQTHDIHKACDAIAFCLVEGNPYILCIELKSSEPNQNEVTRQFNSSQCFLDFLNSILKRYENLSIESWSRRYFLFHDQNKTPLRKEAIISASDNDAPERAKFIPVQSGEKIYLRKLLGKPL